MEPENPHEYYTVYVVADCISGSHLGAVYEVNIDRRGGKVMTGVQDPKFPAAPLLGDPIHEFLEIGQVPKASLMECARLSSCSELYVLLGTGDITRYMKLDDVATHVPRTLPGFVIYPHPQNPEPQCVPFKPPIASKPAGIVISAYDKLYFLAHPMCFPGIPEPSFERYHPQYDEWERLPSFEYTWNEAAMRFIGYAVCHGCILVSAFAGCGRRCEYRVFHVRRGKWYEVEDSPGYAFTGKAVVLGDTIYALPMGRSDVMTFSLRMRSDTAGDVFYSLGKTSLLVGVNMVRPPSPFRGFYSRYLVHLGNMVFCLFETAYNYSFRAGDACQYLCITSFLIEGGEKIKTLDSTVRGVALNKFDKLHVNFCYTLDSGDFDPEEEGYEWKIVMGKKKKKVSGSRLG